MSEIEQEEIQDRPKHRNFEGQEDAPTWYSDNVNLHASTDTVTLVFGRKEWGFDPPFPPKAACVINMSPEFAVRLAELMNRWSEQRESGDSEREDGAAPDE